MSTSLSCQCFMKKHLYRKQSNKERSLWAFFLTLCLAAILGIALSFEIIGGYLPCHLCLLERLPYYGALPLLVLASLLAWVSCLSSLVRFLFICVFVLMATSFVLAIYHAGIEYHFWPAPAHCSLNTTTLTTGVDQLFTSLEKPPASPSCSQAPARFLFLSFAGWNVLASLLYMLLSLYVASKGLLSNDDEK
ncbi:disulfide bond formation protein B [Bartonella sp. WD16.2]|uniref:disulfide bond formation protein B n=1 Tax=Bartonella sp. WD16.2 TaxID=1933904 RepID=UPI00099A3918|nr:disulfide bond formation protein B [Bartonella sp. WD16.2]AQX20393.1 Disulfide bond formation protein DsbB [Bartonella sp. WD16.2]